MTDYRKKIIETISIKTGLEISEIHEDSYLEDDLNIGEIEKTEILGDLEEALEIEGLLEEKDDLETVGDIVDSVADKVE